MKIYNDIDKFTDIVILSTKEKDYYTDDEKIQIGNIFFTAIKNES